MRYDFVVYVFWVKVGFYLIFFFYVYRFFVVKVVVYFVQDTVVFFIYLDAVFYFRGVYFVGDVDGVFLDVVQQFGRVDDFCCEGFMVEVNFEFEVELEYVVVEIVYYAYYFFGKFKQDLQVFLRVVIVLVSCGIQFRRRYVCGFDGFDFFDVVVVWFVQEFVEVFDQFIEDSVVFFVFFVVFFVEFIEVDDVGEDDFFVVMVFGVGLGNFQLFGYVVGDDVFQQLVGLVFYVLDRGAVKVRFYVFMVVKAVVDFEFSGQELD